MKLLSISTLPVVSVLAVLALSSCSSDNGDSHPAGNLPGMSGSSAGGSSSPTAAAQPPANGPHNEADISFATDMIPHHGQAVQMADLALTRGDNGEVKSLAAQITKAQEPEIQLMSGWLRGWGQPVPAASMSMAGASMTDGSMTGMMTDSDMSALAAASGAAFDRSWVRLMITHHSGAVAMSKKELAAGSSAQARVLARQIIDAQTAEIARLHTVLATLPG